MANPVAVASSATAGATIPITTPSLWGGTLPDWSGAAGTTALLQLGASTTQQFTVTVPSGTLVVCGDGTSAASDFSNATGAFLQINTKVTLDIQSGGEVRLNANATHHNTYDDANPVPAMIVRAGGKLTFASTSALYSYFCGDGGGNTRPIIVEPGAYIGVLNQDLVTYQPLAGFLSGAVFQVGTLDVPSTLKARFYGIGNATNSVFRCNGYTNNAKAGLWLCDASFEHCGPLVSSTLLSSKNTYVEQRTTQTDTIGTSAGDLIVNTRRDTTADGTANQSRRMIDDCRKDQFFRITTTANIGTNDFVVRKSHLLATAGNSNMNNTTYTGGWSVFDDCIVFGPVNRYPTPKLPNVAGFENNKGNRNYYVVPWGYNNIKLIVQAQGGVIEDVDGIFDPCGDNYVSTLGGDPGEWFAGAGAISLASGETFQAGSDRLTRPLMLHSTNGGLTWGEFFGLSGRKLEVDHGMGSFFDAPLTFSHPGSPSPQEEIATMKSTIAYGTRAGTWTSSDPQASLSAYGTSWLATDTLDHIQPQGYKNNVLFQVKPGRNGKGHNVQLSAAVVAAQGLPDDTNLMDVCPWADGQVRVANWLTYATSLGITGTDATKFETLRRALLVDQLGPGSGVNHPWYMPGVTRAGLIAHVQNTLRPTNEAVRTAGVGGTTAGPLTMNAPSGTPLVAPTLNAAANVAATSVGLSWSAASGGTPNATAPLYTYAVKLAIGAGAFTTAQTTGGTSASLTGLTPNTAYQAEIVVTDNVGSTATSAPITFTTPAAAAPPVAPSVPTATVSSGGGFFFYHGRRARRR